MSSAGSWSGRRELAGSLAVTVLAAISVGIAIATANRVALVIVAALGAAVLVSAMSVLADTALVVWLVGASLLDLVVQLPASHPIVTFDRAWVGGMAVLALSRSDSEAWSSTTRRLLRLLLCLCLAFAVRGLFSSAATLGAIETAIDAILVPTVLFVWAARFARTGQGVARVLPAFAAAGAILAAIGLAERVGGFELASLVGGAARVDKALSTIRISGPYAVPEVYALVLVICIAATVLWAQLKGRSAYLVGAVLVALESVVVYLTYFRAAWIAALIAIAGCVAIRPGRRLRSALGLGLALAIVLAVFAELSQTSTTFTTRVSDTRNVVGRLAGYQQGFELWDQHPLFGVGVNQYAQQVVDVPAVAISGVNGVTDPHSSFMQVLVEQGVVGVTVFAAVLVAATLVIRRLLRRARTRADTLLANALRAAALGYLVMSLGLAMLPYGASNAFMAVLLGLGAGRLDALGTSEPSLAPARPVLGPSEPSLDPQLVAGTN